MTTLQAVKMNGARPQPASWPLKSASDDRIIAAPRTQTVADTLAQTDLADGASIVAVGDGAPVGIVKLGDLAFASGAVELGDVCSPLAWAAISGDSTLAVAAARFDDDAIELLVIDDGVAGNLHFVTRTSLAAAAVREADELRHRWLANDMPRRSTKSVPMHVTDSASMSPELTSELELNARRYQAILEAQPDCVKVVGRDGCLLEMNPAGLRIMEADSFDQVCGVNVGSLLEPVHQANYRDWERRVLSGEKATIVFEAQGLKGTRKWLEAIGTPLRDAAGNIEAILSVTRDITDRVAAERQLRENEERLRKIFNGLPYYLTLFSVDGELTLVNQTALQSPGFSVDVLSGRQIWETEWINFDPSVVDRIRNAFFDAQRGKSSRFDSPIRMSTGEMKQMEITVHPVCDDQGEVREILGAGVDITARVEAEEQARRLRDEIAHAVRLSTLGEMAANIAHELNQPLAAIVNYAFSARAVLSGSTSNEPEQCAEYLKIVEEQALRAGLIVRSLLQMVRKSPSQRSSADLRRMFDDVLSLIRADLYHERINLVTNFSDEMPVLSVDAVQFQQVLLNLLRNSIEALSGAEGTRRIEVATTMRPGEILVAVTDSGPGVRAPSNGDILDAFVTSKPDGLGLGLTICRRIVEGHGGKLWYESQPDRGTTFSFTLPLSQHKETGE